MQFQQKQGRIGTAAGCISCCKSGLNGNNCRLKKVLAEIWQKYGKV